MIQTSRELQEELDRAMQVVNTIKEKLADAQRLEKDEKIAIAKGYIEEYGLEPTDLFDLHDLRVYGVHGDKRLRPANDESRVKQERKKLDPKYRNPDDPTQTYPGVGPRPEWLKSALVADPSKKMDDFLIPGWQPTSRRAKREAAQQTSSQ